VGRLVTIDFSPLTSFFRLAISCSIEEEEEEEGVVVFLGTQAMGIIRIKTRAIERKPRMILRLITHLQFSIMLF